MCTDPYLEDSGDLFRVERRLAGGWLVGRPLMFERLTVS